MSQTKAQLIDNLVQPITGALGSASAPTFSFTSDPNTGLYSPGADQVAISTAGSGRLFVDANGNIAIGTSATSNFGATARSFDINSAGGIANLYVKTGTVNGGLQADAGNGYMQVWTASNHPIAFNIAFSEKMRLDTSGRLGIGTSSPGKILDVRASNTEVRATCASTDYTAFLAAADGGVNCRIGAYATVDGFAGTTSNHPFSLQTNSATRLYITAAGNVGIGTTSPNSVFHARLPSTSTATIATFDRIDGAVASEIHYDGSDGRITFGTTTNHPLSFETNNTRAVTIDTSQRVGIGTSSPSEVLTVAGNIRANSTNATIGAYGANNSSPQLVLGNSAGTIQYSIYETLDGSGNRGSLNIYDAVAAANRVTVDTSGRVGIGTTSPAGKCVVRVSNNTGAPTAWNSNFLVVSNGDASTSSGIGFSVDTSDSSASISALTPGTGWLKQYYRANSHTFWYGDAGVTQGMTLDSSGRLLVGTSSASGNALLQVAGGIRQSQLSGKPDTAGLPSVGETRFYSFNLATVNTWETVLTPSTDGNALYQITYRIGVSDQTRNVGFALLYYTTGAALTLISGSASYIRVSSNQLQMLFDFGSYGATTSMQVTRMN